jgi:hypothetical protein
MLVQIIGIIGPMVIITVIYFKKRNVYDLHHAILGTFTFSPDSLFYFINITYSEI